MRGEGGRQAHVTQPRRAGPQSPAAPAAAPRPAPSRLCSSFAPSIGPTPGFPQPYSPLARVDRPLVRPPPPSPPPVQQLCVQRDAALAALGDGHGGRLLDQTGGRVRRERVGVRGRACVVCCGHACVHVRVRVRARLPPASSLNAVQSRPPHAQAHANVHKPNTCTDANVCMPKTLTRRGPPCRGPAC